MPIFSELLASPTQKSLLYVVVITNTKITTLCWCYHQHKNTYVIMPIFSELVESPTQNHYSMLVLLPTKKHLCYYHNFLRVAGITKTKITWVIIFNKQP
jgi:hypothetical protein